MGSASPVWHWTSTVTHKSADTAAKAGLDEPITDMKFLVIDLLPCVNQLCTREWQTLWSQCTSNKLYSVQPVIGHHTKASSLSRHDRVVINRFRVGHTRLTNSYLLKGENQPECQACQSSLTVKLVLIDCTQLSAVCQRYFRVDTLKELFEIVESRNIIAFIKDINFYHCIYR